MGSDILLCYREFNGCDEKYPSMRESFEVGHYENQEIIARYLEENGRFLAVSASLPTDLFTKEYIDLPYGNQFVSDGNYSWTYDLSYYVRKYNMRLPKEFEDYVLAKERMKNL